MLKYYTIIILHKYNLNILSQAKILLIYETLDYTIFIVVENEKLWKQVTIKYTFVINECIYFTALMT